MKNYFIFIIFAIFFGSSFAMADDVDSTQPAQQSYIFNISYDDAQDAISKALTEKLGEKLGEKLATDKQTDKQARKTIAATINGKKATPLYSSNKPVNVEIRGLKEDSEKNSWSASMLITSDDNVISAMPLAGRYSVMSEVPVFRHALKNGDIISQADIELKSFPEVRTSSDIIIDTASIIGKTPIRAISPSRPIRTNEIAGISLVKKNALVQMRYKTDYMEITTTGQALADGARGDVIEIRNVTSKKTTRAVVADNNIVDILAQNVQTSQVAAAPTATVNY